MAGCIFSAPSEGKGLVVVNIFFGLVEPRPNQVAGEFHKVSLLYCMCGAWPTGVSSKENVTHRKLTERRVQACALMYTSLYMENTNMDE